MIDCLASCPGCVVRRSIITQKLLVNDALVQSVSASILFVWQVVLIWEHLQFIVVII